MKRMLLALALALLVFVSLSVGVAGGSHSNGQGPNKDLMSGTGKDSTPDGTTDFHLHVDAQSGPEARNSRDHFDLRSVGPVLNIDATGEEEVCLGVRGNKAVLIGIVERNEREPSDPVNRVLLWVKDNGEGEGATDGFAFHAGPVPGPLPHPTGEVCRGLG